MKKRLLHIQQMIALALLMVFAIALTPFAALHHHHHDEPVCVKSHVDCGHKFHVHEQTDNCLICKAHFEKSFTYESIKYQYYAVQEALSLPVPVIKGSYAQLIGQALRGPPVAQLS